MWKIQVILLLLLLITGISVSLPHNVDWVGILKRSQNDYKSSLMQQIFLDTPLDSQIRNRDIEQRLRSVEERLRSLEQPLWAIESASKIVWDRCTEGGTGCQCEPSTKRLSCWRNKLNFLPANQLVPNDVLAM